MTKVSPPRDGVGLQLRLQLRLHLSIGMVGKVGEVVAFENAAGQTERPRFEAERAEMATEAFGRERNRLGLAEGLGELFE